MTPTATTLDPVTLWIVIIGMAVGSSEAEPFWLDLFISPLLHRLRDFNSDDF